MTQTSADSINQHCDDSCDVIAVGAHPDDVDVACGGTLALLSQQGYRVAIVDLTDGEPTPGCPSPEIRIEESRRAAATLGVAQRIQLGLPNRKLFDAPQHRIALATVFRRLRPKLVLGFGDKTPMASPDHWQAMQITDGAIFYSRLSKWDDQFDELPPHAIDRHLYFRLALEPDSIPHLTHHLTVDISDVLETKIQAIQCFESQFGHRPSILDRVRAAAIVTGSAAGVQFGESFAAAKPFAVTDLVRAVLDEAGHQSS
jgi:bacillithiol biosynthesis deacetylase BshB1